MADYGTAGKLSNPNTQFTKVQARRAPDVRESQLNTLVQGAKGAGKAYAASEGRELTGGDKSQADVNNQADIAEQALDTEVGKAMTAVEGPLQERTQLEIKDEQLSKFATDDRTLLELRDRGTISTTEARARRQLNLQRALSNPINALFKGDFLNAASSLTGGAKGASGELFPYTPEEAQALAVQAAKSKAVAEHEAKVAGTIAATGQSDTVVRNEFAKQNIASQRLAEYNRLKQERSLNSEEVADENSLFRSSSSRGLYADIATRSTANGGKGLTADDMVIVGRTQDQQYRGMLEAINTNQTIGSGEREAERKKLEAWHVGMKESMKAYDGASLDENRIKQLQQMATLEGWEHMPSMMFLQTVAPKVLELTMVQGGVNKNLDTFMGKGTSTKLMDMTGRMASAAKFSMGQPPEGPDVAGMMVATITNGGSKAGLEYLSSPDVQGDRGQQINLAKIYDATPAVTLQAFSTVDAQRLAPQSVEFRGEINKGLAAAKDKMDRIKARIGAEGEVIFAEKQYFKESGGFGKKGEEITQFPGKSPNWVLNLPDGMQEYSDDLKAMHNMVVKQPWSWSHVKEDYIDGSDAFNGYMRGEWDVNVNMDDGGKALGDVDSSSKVIKSDSLDPASFNKLQSSKPAASFKAEEKFQPKIPRGKGSTIAIDNNNPGNLRALGIDFEGKVGEVETSSGKFAKFDSPEMGMRALARDLNTKIERGVDTIQKIIEVYSPDSDPENQKREFEHQDYVDFVVRKTGMDPNKKLKLSDRNVIMEAISQFESGFQPWSKALIKEGIRLADEI